MDLIAGWTIRLCELCDAITHGQVTRFMLTSNFLSSLQAKRGDFDSESEPDEPLTITECALVVAALALAVLAVYHRVAGKP